MSISEDAATGEPVESDETDAQSATVDGDGGAESEVTPAVAEADQRYLRLAADFENFRRRKNQELTDRARYASEDAARLLLPVLDNLRRAVAHADPASDEQLINGIELVVREFETAFEKLGITPIDAVGEPFDPALHEAIAGEDSETVDVDTVVDEVQRGYRLHDRVLRPSMVRIAHPARPSEGA